MAETIGSFLGAPTVLIVPAFLFVITVVVFFHELGHFLAARACGVKVDVSAHASTRSCTLYTES